MAYRCIPFSSFLPLLYFFFPPQNFPFPTLSCHSNVPCFPFSFRVFSFVFVPDFHSFSCLLSLFLVLFIFVFLSFFLPFVYFLYNFSSFFLHFPSVFSRGTYDIRVLCSTRRRSWKHQKEGHREVVDIYGRWILKWMSLCAAEGTGWNRLKINSVSDFYEN